MPDDLDLHLDLLLTSRLRCFAFPPLFPIPQTTPQRTKQDLEFLQLLSNPQYLQHLAQQRFFEDPSFLNYLKYLNYFRRPEFVKFVSYPDALEFLDLLVSSAAFRKAIARPNVAEMVREQQMWQWRGGGSGEVKAEDAGEAGKEEAEAAAG